MLQALSPSRRDCLSEIVLSTVHPWHFLISSNLEFVSRVCGLALWSIGVGTIHVALEINRRYKGLRDGRDAEDCTFEDCNISRGN